MAGPDLSVSVLSAAKDAGRILEIHAALAGHCPHSFFQSPHWVATWLDCLPDDRQPAFIVAYRGSEPAACFFLGRTRVRRHGFVRSRQLSLNATGEATLDALQIEYNNVLTSPDLDIDVLAVLQAAGIDDWDELVIPGVLPADMERLFPASSIERTGHSILTDVSTETYFVDLAQVRNADNDYFKLLSSSKRNQIRKSIRAYQKDGPLTLQEAKNVDEALEMLAGLKRLHQAEWQRRGETGAFASGFFNEFHTRLVRRCFPSGEIQLLHLSAGGKTIGYLYNFVYRDDVLFYQSGFDYREDNVYRPGLVAHVEAVTANAKRGLARYDFLAGTSQYKKSLSTNSHPMIWNRIQRKRLAFQTESILKSLKARLSVQQGK